MTFRLDRRQLLALGTFGLGAMAVPGAATIAAARGFTHNVASGEPGHDRMLLWTRYVPPSGGDARLEYQLSRTVDFARIAARGSATARAERDHCVKVVARGLQPGQYYYYRFRDRAGNFSPVGRTRTLSDGAVASFKLGIFSCANLPYGWFNAYAHAAQRDDIDLMLHLGDYVYEYARGKYPTAPEALPGRILEPANEAVQLADYRLRYAAYRADPDLQQLHQRFPMVMMWDDHETANDSWAGGAENHQPESEGAWEARKRAAIRVYREWMPISDEPWQSYEIGNLATLFRPETRLIGRSKPLDLGETIRGKADIGAALVEFRDGAWRDPTRTMLGLEQERWLGAGFRRSARQGTRWQLLAQQVLMGSVSMPPRTASWIDGDTLKEVRQRTAVGLAASRVGLSFNFDQWDGYPVARERLLRSALDADANLIVLSGDTHNGWAFDLDLAGTPAGVEFGVQSVTSPGFEAYLPKVNPRDMSQSLVEHNRQLKWANTHKRGYMIVALTPERATGEWLFLDTVRARSLKIADQHRMTVSAGANRLA